MAKAANRGRSRSPFDLTGKVAIVTGSGRGLGKGMAEALGAAGAKVVTGSRTLREAAATAGRIRQRGGEATAFRVDITERPSVEALVASALTTYRRIDVLVCNASTYIHKPALEMGDADWQRILATELVGYFNCAQAVAPAMFRQGGGSIIMVSANSSEVGYRELTGVAAAKGAVDMLARNLAVEWGDRGIRVNTINPGYTEHVPSYGSDVNPGKGDIDAEVRRLTPLMRRGRIEELAHPVVFLASDAASFITGVNLMVDGGYAIK